MRRRNTGDSPMSWAISWLTAMFMHASWDHLLGNMLFLAIFGKNVEDAFGHLRYLAFYVAGGFAAARDDAPRPITGTPPAGRAVTAAAASRVAAS